MNSTIYHHTVFKTAKLSQDKIGKGQIIIKFPFDRETLSLIKTISGCKFNSDGKNWFCPLSVGAIDILKRGGFILDESLLGMFAKNVIKVSELTPIEIPGLKGELRPFQNICVAFADKKDGNFLNGDDMGLGKTIETLAFLQLKQQNIPALIVCPSVVKINWQREAQKWLSFNARIQILEGQTSYKITGDIIIINYDILSYWEKYLTKYPFKIIIADEGQAIKNNTAERTRAFKAIKKKIEKVIFTTGTPIENNPGEIYNMINMVEPTLFPVFWDFAWEFCEPKHTRAGWEYKGATNIPKLHKILTDSIMIRMLKSDVLSELPPKTFSFVPIELTNRKEYNSAEKDYINWVRGVKGDFSANKIKYTEARAKTEGLKQIAVKGKINGVKSWIDDFLESGKKLVVVTTHVFVLDELMANYPGISVKIDGSVTDKKRQQAIDDFQTDPTIKLIFLQLIAGGIGITLTAAWDEIIIELGWSPKKMDQVIDRVHRFTQMNAVNIYYLLALNTIEEKIAALLDRKRKVIDGVIDGKETDEDSLITQLIKEYY